MSAPDNLSFNDNPAAVHVWTASLDVDASELAAWSVLLDADETARANRFHFERDRRHFTVARATLRILLGRYLRVGLGSVRFEYGPRGKPFVSSPETSVRFNVSHSHGRALFAFAWEKEVGVDVEAGARLGNDWPGLVRRVFSDRERLELAAMPADRQRTAFLNGWTRKEAYLKATGLGIVDGLQSIEVTLDPDHPVKLLAGPAGVKWHLHDLGGDDTFAAALVVAGTTAAEIRRFDCHDLPPITGQAGC